jgi:hypothetical protein
MRSWSPSRACVAPHGVHASSREAFLPHNRGGQFRRAIYGGTYTFSGFFPLCPLPPIAQLTSIRARATTAEARSADSPCPDRCSACPAR